MAAPEARAPRFDPLSVVTDDNQAAAAAPAACPECGEAIPERFCTRCGEKRVEARDYSLRHYLAEALNVFANLESPVPRSFFALLFRPGLLTSEYFAGRRKRYLKPLQLFVFCNVFFFFAQPLTGFNSLTTPLEVHLTGMPYKQAARRMVGAEVERRQTTLEEYRAGFDATIQNQAKSLVILMVPLLALALLPLYRRRRRYFVEHLVFATHFYSFFLLLLLALFAAANAYFGAARRLGLPLRGVDFEGIFTAVFLAACGAYLYLALRRVYRQTRRATFLKCLALVFAAAYILQLYRFVLFFTAFYTV
jgi:hypothetical protein